MLSADPSLAVLVIHILAFATLALLVMAEVAQVRNCFVFLQQNPKNQNVVYLPWERFEFN